MPRFIEKPLAPGTADNSLSQFSFQFIADGIQATTRFIGSLLLLGIGQLGVFAS